VIEWLPVQTQIAAMKKLFITFTILFLTHITAGSPSVCAQAVVDSRMSGSWYDPVHSGEGFALQILNDGVAVVYWFTYDETGAQRWFFGVGEVDGDTAVFGELLAGSGATFGTAFDSDDVILSNVGNLSITWTDCSNAIADYTVDGVTGSQSLDRLTSLMGLECTAPIAGGTFRTGSWFDFTHNGEGLAIEALSDGRVLVYWFSYDHAGKPAWFFGVGELLKNEIAISKMYSSSGGLFGPDFDPEQIELKPWGSVVIELGCDYGKLDYISELPAFGTGKLTLTRLTSVGEFNCAEPASPNILLVIADDLGLDASSQYNISAQLPHTPEIDALANQGLVFENAWSYPSCTPTRSSILTGKYGAQTGVVEVGDVLSTSETSLQSYIHQHLPGKYSDAVIGKWHLGPGRDIDHPGDMGIAYYAGIIGGGVEAYDNWQLTLNGEQTTQTEYVTSKLVDLAIDWVDKQDSPWFLWLAFNAPHTPFHLPPGNLHDRVLTGTSEDIESNPLPYYLAAIEAMDTEIGRLLDSFDAATRENTLIIFIGDNGTPGQVAQAPFERRKAKGSLYQGGINVPLLVSGPGVSGVGERESALVNTTDLFGTIASLAGVNVSEVNDSISFADLLSGEPEYERGFQYSERLTETAEEWAVSDGEFKLIESSQGDTEFYQLSNDPYESEDLVANGTAPAFKLEALQLHADQVRQQP
jgi:arylsulfatase B